MTLLIVVIATFLHYFLEIITHAFRTIFVSRSDANSRQLCCQEIERRASSGGQWPPVLIFPEGKLVHLSSHSCYTVLVIFCNAATTTNRKRILQFKNGKLRMEGFLKEIIC